MLRLDRVSFAFEEEKKIIDDISFTVREGETVGLIGPNGAGKTTLLRLLPGLLNGEGEIRVAGLPVQRQNLKEIRRKMGIVLQNADHQMFMPTVLEDLLFAPLNYGMTREEAEERADRVLADLGIEDLKHSYNHKLSGGEKKMAAIAAVLAMEPEAVLMDEPTSALDPYNRRLIIRTISGMKETRLIASHDLDMILESCSRVILLSEGRIAADGKAEEVLRDRALLEANHLELPLSLSRG